RVAFARPTHEEGGDLGGRNPRAVVLYGDRDVSTLRREMHEDAPPDVLARSAPQVAERIADERGNGPGELLAIGEDETDVGLRIDAELDLLASALRDEGREARSQEGGDVRSLASQDDRARPLGIARARDRRSAARLERREEVLGPRERGRTRDGAHQLRLAR